MYCFIISHVSVLKIYMALIFSENLKALMPSKLTVWMASESNPDVSYLTCHCFPSYLLKATAFHILGP